MTEKEQEQLDFINATVKALNKDIKNTEIQILNTKDTKAFFNAKAEYQKLVDKKLALIHKPSNAYLVKNQFLNWTEKHGKVILGLPYTVQDKADGGYTLNNLETATTVWTKFNLNALKEFSKHANVAIKFGNGKYNDEIMNGTTQDF